MLRIFTKIWVDDLIYNIQESDCSLLEAHFQAHNKRYIWPIWCRMRHVCKNEDKSSLEKKWQLSREHLGRARPGRVADQDWVRYAVVACCALCRGLWRIHPSHNPPPSLLHDNIHHALWGFCVCAAVWASPSQCSPPRIFLHLHLLSKFLTVYIVYMFTLSCVEVWTIFFLQILTKTLIS